MIWRGTASKTLSRNPRKNADRLNKAVTKMFRKFPPGSKKDELTFQSDSHGHLECARHIQAS